MFSGLIIELVRTLAEVIAGLILPVEVMVVLDAEKTKPVALLINNLVGLLVCAVDGAEM